MAKRDIIYQYIFSDGSTYIGKLANDTDVLWTHMQWLPWIKSKKELTQQSSWELLWKNDVNQNGFKNQSFVSAYGYLGAAEVEYNIRASMSNFTTIVNGIETNFFDLLCDLWHVNTKDACEALCILLATNQKQNMQNTQIDFLSRVSGKQRLTQKDIQSLISNEEFKRRYTVAIGGLADKLYLNFNRRNQSVLQDILDQLQISLTGRTTKSGAIIFSDRDTKKLATALTYHITKNTITDLVKQIKAAGTKRGRTNEQLQPMIEEIVAALENKAYTKSGNIRRTTTYGDLFKIIYGYVNNQTANQWTLFEQNNDINLQKTMELWLQQTRLEDVFPVQLHGITIEDENTYKIKLSRWIQENVFGHFMPNQFYTLKQQTKYLQSTHSRNGDAWLPPTGEEYNSTLISQTKAYLPQNSFIFNSWFNGTLESGSMYGEQVSIWLNNAGAPFSNWNNLIRAFYNQPTSINDTNRITFY